MGCEPVVKGKKLYGDLVPSRWRSELFLSRGILPGGLPPNFLAKNLYEAYSIMYSELDHSKLKDLQKSKGVLIDYTFPRPGVEKRRRTAFLINPLHIMLANRIIEES